MRKMLLTYFNFAIASLVVIVVFLTTTTYTQLALGILLYPLLALFAYKVFSRRSLRTLSREVGSRIHVPVEPKKKVEAAKEENAAIADINKRTFLKLIGATGISFFLISIFGRRIEPLLMGQNTMQASSSNGNPPIRSSSPSSPTEGYHISEIDDNIISYFGFINKDGGWFIMKGDTNTGSFRYTKGTSNFPVNWKNRANLKYDYLHKVFF